MIQPDVRDPLGVRDRAILETFYSTGIRRMELVNLKLYNVDHLRGTLLGRRGRGRKIVSFPSASGRWRGWINICAKRGRSSSWSRTK